MSKLKGRKKLNKVVSAQLKCFGVKAELSTEYAYYFNKALITFKLTENTIEDELFNQFIYDRFDYKVENTFMISILHEVGHHLANDEIDNTIFDFCMDEKDRIIEAIKNTTTYEEVQKLEYQYFNLPDEIMATQWAVNFIRNHALECDIMWEHIKTALFKFYKKNGLTE